jgi:hypothetical protein
MKTLGIQHHAPTASMPFCPALIGQGSVALGVLVLSPSQKTI